MLRGRTAAAHPRNFSDVFLSAEIIFRLQCIINALRSVLCRRALCLLEVRLPHVNQRFFAMFDLCFSPEVVDTLSARPLLPVAHFRPPPSVRMQPPLATHARPVLAVPLLARPQLANAGVAKLDPKKKR